MNQDLASMNADQVRRLAAGEARESVSPGWSALVHEPWVPVGEAGVYLVDVNEKYGVIAIAYVVSCLLPGVWVGGSEGWSDAARGRARHVERVGPSATSEGGTKRCAIRLSAGASQVRPSLN